MKENKTLYEKATEELRELSEALAENGIRDKFNEYKEIVNKIVLENNLLEIDQENESLMSVRVKIAGKSRGRFLMKINDFQETIVITLVADTIGLEKDQIDGSYNSNNYILSFTPTSNRIIDEEIPGTSQGFEKIFTLFFKKIKEIILYGNKF